MALTYAAYNATLENQKEKETEVEMLKWKYDKLRKEMNQQFNQILSLIQKNPLLAQVKPEVLANKKMQ